MSYEGPAGPGQGYGPARLLQTLFSVGNVNFTPNGTLPSGATDLGVSVTVLGNGRPVVVELNAIAQIARATAGQGAAYLFIVDAADPTHYLTESTVQANLAANIAQIQTANHDYVDPSLAAGASRTYKVYAGQSTSAATTMALFARDFFADFDLIARNT